MPPSDIPVILEIQRKKGESGMNVLCYGDSNTYGYDPRGYFGGRYDAGSRWVDILAARTGWAVSNQGQNGKFLRRRRSFQQTRIC